MGTRRQTVLKECTRHWPGPRAAMAILIVAATGVAACESVTEPESSAGLAADAGITAPRAADIGLLEEVSEELQLTDEQRADLKAIGERYADGQAGPASGWQVARDVQAVLTSEQIERAQSIAVERRQALTESRFAGQRTRAKELEGQRGPAFLDLTEDQRAAAQQIRDTYGSQLRALHEQRGDESVAPEELRTQARELQEQMKEAFGAILTDEQKSEFEQHKAERQARAGEERETMKARRESMKEAMVEGLSLTDEQLARLEALREAHGDMGPRRHASGPGVAEKREEHQAALSEILSEEQMEIMAVHRILSSARAHMGSFAEDARPRGRRAGPRR